MKKALLTLALASIAANVVIASQTHDLSNDALPPLIEENAFSLQELKEKKRTLESRLSGQSEDDKLVQRILVFYQPSYADKFGEDVIHSRIEKAVLKDYQKVVGSYRNIEILDIVPLTSVPNYLPFQDRIDLSGDTVSLGYNHENVLEEGIFNILDVPITEGTPERALVEYYKPELVTIFRERRVDEDKLLGQARLSSTNSVIFDSGTGLLTPELDNLLSTTVPHEFGHNHFLKHEVGADEDGDKVDAYGRYTSNHATQCGDAVTLMWSVVGDSVEALDFYSSPDKHHKGEQCGYLPDQEGTLNGAENQEYFDLYFKFLHSQNESDILKPNNELSFVNSSFSVSESDGFFMLEVKREGDVSESAHVYVRSTGRGAASYPEDVIQYKVKADFSPGQSTATVRFDVMQDALDESSEVIELEMVYPFGTGISSGKASVRINDSFISPEERGVVTLLKPLVSFVEGEVGYIEFGRTQGSKGDVLISLLTDYHLIEDTGLELFEKKVSHSFRATESRDFIMPAKYVVMRDGETSLRVPVQTLDDLDPEAIEGIAMSFESLSGDEVIIESKDSGALLISDDDAARAGILAIEADELTIKESDGAIDFTVFRDLGFEGGVPFEVEITIDYGKGKKSVLKLLSVFDLKPESSNFVIEDEEDGDSAQAKEGRYEAIKYFTHNINPTSGVNEDYTVTVRVNNLIENGLVDPSKNEIIFTVIDDKGALISSSEGQNGGGSMNIVYLLVIISVAWFHRSKKMVFNR